MMIVKKTRYVVSFKKSRIHMLNRTTGFKWMQYLCPVQYRIPTCSYVPKEVHSPHPFGRHDVVRKLTTNTWRSYWRRLPSIYRTIWGSIKRIMYCLVLLITSLAKRTIPPTPLVMVFSTAMININKSVVHRMTNRTDIRKWKRREGPGYGRWSICGS